MSELWRVRGPDAESGHAPEPADHADRVLEEARRQLYRRGFLEFEQVVTMETIQGLLDAGVIVAGPAVTGRIEEQQ